MDRYLHTPATTGDHQLDILVLPDPFQRLQQVWDVLPGIDQADVEDEALGEVVLGPYGFQCRGGVNLAEVSRGREVDRLHLFRIEIEKPDHIFARVLRHRDDRGGAPQIERIDG